MANTRYFLSRVAQALITFISVLTLTFALIRLMPGGPAALIRAQLETSGQSFTEEEINNQVELYTQINPETPIPQAYVEYVTSVLTGNLGESIWYSRSVMEILADAMPWTIFLSAVSLLFIYAIGVALGAAMAYVEGSKFDFSSSLVSVVITSVPFYVIAIILLWFGGYEWGLFPTGGRVSQDVAPGLTIGFIGSILYHAAMPLAALIIAGFGGRALAMRGNSIQVLGNDYLRVARLRGLSERRISLKYVGRNAILPMYTSIMISIGSLFGGSIILEQIFSYPGAGYYVLNALNARDYPLLMGGFLFITLGVVVGVFIADLTYGLVDPRTGSGADRESF
ncbi:ABC transporter permease [Saliphagus sp. LR7]|uniref:ABC transporter permease n=1 Tax=Saliphagus sp. LR7 TaxID=2282654 RepID=UPI000DF7ECAC|nr:ABC transporter permease [Saliphagus sp. LR7]